MWFMPQAAIKNIPEMAVCGFSFSKTVGEKQFVLTERTLLSTEATNTFTGHLLLSSRTTRQVSN